MAERIYLQYSFQTEAKNRDLLLAHLSLLGFDGFEETDEGWRAYLLSGPHAPDIADTLAELSAQIPFSFTSETIPNQNWNAVWEAGFAPIRVGDFCGVRADFHPPMPDVEHEIIINPKMAFGTGHHATTYMMLAAMASLPTAGKKTLDYGCGTGILAILAAQLGAAPIDAVDIEEEACENSLENCRANGVDDINVFHGTLDRITTRDYALILANINRNVILDSLPALYDKLLPDGLLLISGILVEDLEKVRSSALENRFEFLEMQERTGWLSILFKKPGI